MSVINQVLRDLDKRQQTAQGARVRSHYQPATGRPWVWVASLTGAILLSAVITWWLVAHALTPTEPDVGAMSAEKSQEETGQVDIALVENVQAESPRLANVQNANTQPERLQTETPASVNSQAENAHAAETLAQPIADEKAYTTEQQRGGEPEVSETAVVDMTEVQPTDDNVDVAERGQHNPAQQTASTQRNESTQAEGDRGEISVQRVERSASELAAQRLDQAINAMESGEGRKAESLLQEALVLAPEFIDARQQLAAYYYGRGFSSEALRVLRDGLAHAPANSRLLTLSARIYEESGRADEALGMLNRIDADLPKQTDIVVLRAALANELGQYQTAADDYRQLLGLNQNQGIWWLGLAVAEEGLANYDAARQAYKRAGEDMGLDRASREYARSREEALAAW